MLAKVVLHHVVQNKNYDQQFKQTRRFDYTDSHNCHRIHYCYMGLVWPQKRTIRKRNLSVEIIINWKTHY